MKPRLVAALLVIACCAAPAQESAIYGAFEPILLYLDETQPARAKLDTGADGSSLHAARIERFERKGEIWLRVRTRLGERALTIERPLIDDVIIKRKNADAVRRPVIELEFCIGTARRRALFNLVDRSGFSTPVLLGKNVLRELGPVDAKLRDTRPPRCGTRLTPPQYAD